MELAFITADILAAIDANARAEAPLEACGLLLGRVVPAVEGAALAGPHAAASLASIELIETADDDALVAMLAPSDMLAIEQLMPARNASPEPTRYLIHPEDHFRAVREARRQGIDIIGAWHSHAISRPVPSPTDLAEAHPNFLYLIASPQWDLSEGSETRAWWLVDGNFREVTLVPVP